ncbi:hypothetical protein ACH5RR_027708 [Cinchona calisaya]|uniref:Pentatricopeptide repeat-containing protein n=1 Tax=Cinchona calisaya TaxID=153742 RepID=A0ABD2YR40_9GENT
MAATAVNPRLVDTNKIKISSLKVPNSIILLQMCHFSQEVKQLHAQLIVSGLIHHPLNPGRLIESYVSTSHFSYALSVFESIPRPDIFAYNTMIRGLLMLGHDFPDHQSLSLFQELLSNGLIPDNHTYTFVLKTCSYIKAISEGKQVHGQIIKAGVEPNTHVITSLIHMYSNCGRMKSAGKVLAEVSDENILAMNAMITGCFSQGQIEIARGLFDKMRKRDTATWSVMITGYTKRNMHAEALSIFREMMASQVSLNEATLVSALSACAHLGALDQGRWIHRYIEKNGVNLSVSLGTAMVDMYAKCGCISCSYEVFRSIPRKDAVTWGVIISGFSVHGEAGKCFELFDEMIESGICPNEVIFVAILSACSHAGYVKSGCHYFNQMVHRYRIRPSIEHYGCMVDLLGRAGRLADAEELISCMSGKPNSVIWGALLNACRIHKDLKRGERAVKELVNLGPMSADRYKQVGSFFAAMGAKENANGKWNFVTDKNLDIANGLSFIEVDGIVHEFVVWDISHTKSADIYKMLDGTD